MRTIAKVPLRRGEVDQDFDQEELAALLDQEPFNVAIADLYQSRFRACPASSTPPASGTPTTSPPPSATPASTPGRSPARRRSASWPRSSPRFERGEVDVLCNAMLLAEGWNSPRATICMHLAPTASRRVYQQRVGRVTRRNPGKEAGLVIDFVHPATTRDETIVTLHSLLDRDVYRGGAIVVGPVRRGRGRRVRVERRVVPVSADPERRLAVLERELWRIAVENLNYSEQHAWAALAGARVTANNWRRAKAMIQHDQAKELRRRFLLTCLQRNRNQQLRLKALAEVAALREAEAVRRRGRGRRHLAARRAPRRARRSCSRRSPSKRIGRRDQAQAWVWRLAEITRELHEEYAVQRWPETKRLLGLFVNSSGRAHGRNARRIVHAARQQDRRLAVVAARRRGRPHARGRGGAARRPDADGPQAVGRRPRAAAQLPQGRRAQAPALGARRAADGKLRPARAGPERERLEDDEEAEAGRRRGGTRGRRRIRLGRQRRLRGAPRPMNSGLDGGP